jgi:hypothetical protein
MIIFSMIFIVLFSVLLSPFPTYITSQRRIGKSPLTCSNSSIARNAKPTTHMTTSNATLNTRKRLLRHRTFLRPTASNEPKIRQPYRSYPSNTTYQLPCESLFRLDPAHSTKWMFEVILLMVRVFPLSAVLTVCASCAFWSYAASHVKYLLVFDIFHLRNMSDLQLTIHQLQDASYQHLFQ